MGGLSSITDPLYTLYPEPLQKEEEFVKFANTVDIFKNIFLKELNSIHVTYNFKLSDRNILKNLCEFLAIDYSLYDNEEILRRKLMLSGFYYKKNYSTIFFLKEEIKKIIGYYPDILETYGFYNQHFLQYKDDNSLIKNFIVWNQLDKENYFLWMQFFNFNIPIVIDLKNNFPSDILNKIYNLVAKYKSASAKVSIGYSNSTIVDNLDRFFSQNFNYSLEETYLWSQTNNLNYILFLQYKEIPDSYTELKVIYSTDLSQTSERNIPRNFFYQF